MTERAVLHSEALHGVIDGSSSVDDLDDAAVIKLAESLGGRRDIISMACAWAHSEGQALDTEEILSQVKTFL
jgi:hypothetical protein